MKLNLKISTLIFLICFLFQNSYSQQDASGWYWLTGQPTGNTLRAVKFFNTSTIYAIGTRGTFLKSLNGGSTWSVNSQVGSPDNSSTGNLATRDLFAMWFMDANTGVTGGATQIAASGVAPGVISRTSDGGNTWSYIQYNDTAGTINGFYFINATTGYLCGGNRARFFKTIDGGLTWSDLSVPLPNNTYNAVYAVDENNIYLATSTNRVYVTNDGGVSWTPRTLPGASVTIMDVVFKDANTGYACGNPNYFAYTTDAGVSWTQSNAPATVGQRDLDYDGGVLYMSGSYNEIFSSVNDGVSWTSINFHDGSNVNQPDPFIMYSMDAAGSNIAVVGNAGTINISNTGGSIWSNKNYSVSNVIGSFGNNNYASMDVSSNEVSDGNSSEKIWLGPSGGGYLLYSTNSGANWVKRVTQHTRSVLDIEFVDDVTGYICGGFPNNPIGIAEISKTTDGGLTWTLLTFPEPMASSQINSVSFPNANTGYAAAFRSPFESEFIYKTTDGGLTWVGQSLETNPNGSVSFVKMLNVDTGYALGNSGGAYYTTTNGGANWLKNTDPYITSTSWSNMFVYSKDIIYLNGNGTAGQKKVIRSLDGGSSWTDLTGNLLSTFTAFKTRWLNLKHGIVSGTNGYMAKTTNGGVTWTATNPGGSTTVDCAIPNKNTWYAISDRNSSYESWRKFENLTSISLNITMGIEGFWNGKPMITDTVKVELRNSTAPYALVDQAKEVVNINGYSTYEFYTAATGSYYIVLKHRNGLETWSAAPMTLASAGNYNYDFTTAASKAYGNNMILKSGLYCIYSGDVNQDGIIDLTDEGLIDNDVLNFLSGYLPTDVNGDGIVDVSDLGITDNNSFNIVTLQRP